MFVRINRDSIKVTSGISWAAIILFIFGMVLMLLWFFKPPMHLLIPIRAFGILFVLGGVLFISKDPWKSIVINIAERLVKIREKSLLSIRSIDISLDEINGYQIKREGSDEKPGIIRVILLLKNTTCIITLFQGTSKDKSSNIENWLKNNGINELGTEFDHKTNINLNPMQIEWSLWQNAFGLIIAFLIGINFLWLIHGAILEQQSTNPIIWIALIILYLFVFVVAFTFLQYIFGKNTLSMTHDQITFGYILFGRKFYTKTWNLEEVERVIFDIGHADTRSLYLYLNENEFIPPGLGTQSSSSKGLKTFEIPIGSISLSGRYELIKQFKIER